MHFDRKSRELCASDRQPDNILTIAALVAHELFDKWQNCLFRP